MAKFICSRELEMTVKWRPNWWNRARKNTERYALLVKAHAELLQLHRVLECPESTECILLNSVGVEEDELVVELCASAGARAEAMRLLANAVATIDAYELESPP